MNIKLPKDIPKLIGHKNIPLRLITHHSVIPEYLSTHSRLKVFYHKGVKCTFPGCKRHGYYLIETVDSGGSKHIDLYTVDFHLMTIDHVIPKSKGGSNNLDNLEPMCEYHNTKKKDFIYEPNQKK